MIFWLFISFLIGLIFMEMSLTFKIIIGLLLLIILIRKFKIKRSLIFFTIFCVGLGFSFIPLEEKEMKNQTIYGFVIESETNYYLLKSGIHSYYVYEENNEVDALSFIKVKGNIKELSFSSIESQFDFENYLNQKGVYNELEVSEKELIIPNIFRPKEKMNDFLNHFNVDGKIMLEALLFSKRNYDHYSTSNFTSLSIVHLFSISGIYVYLTLSFLNYIFTMFFKERRANLISLSILSIFAILTFPSFSIIRILFIKGFEHFNHYRLNDKFSKTEVLSIVAISFLLINFNLASQLSFQFGFIASFIINFLNLKIRETSGIKRKLLFTFTLAFVFLPFNTAQNGEFNILFALFQLVFAPMNGVIFVSGFFFYLTYPIFPFFINFLSSFVLGLSNVFASLPLSLHVPGFMDVELIIYLLCFLVLIYSAEIKYRKLFKWAYLAIIAVNVIHFIPISNYLTSSVHFINVGQGDSTLIMHRGATCLIDTGGIFNLDVAKESLIPYLKKQRIYRLDYLIITHEDFDHNGAKESLIKKFPVGKVIENQNNFPLNLNGLILENLNYTNLDRGENDASFVIKFSLNDMKFLLMGDASSEVENKLISSGIDLSTDILKLGHHGSKSSSSYEFLKVCNPDEVIISAGENNRYGHPSKDTLSRLERLDIKYRLTYLEGTITYRLI